MSRKMLIVVVVVAVMLATLIAPAAATSFGAGDTVSVPAKVGSGFGGRLFDLSRPIQLAGDGGCCGAGDCPT